jgi:hypothetical protein
VLSLAARRGDRENRRSHFPDIEWTDDDGRAPARRPRAGTVAGERDGMLAAFALSGTQRVAASKRPWR